MKSGIKVPKDTQLNVLSLFSGCGGMDLGFEGGFNVLRESINENVHPEWNVKKNGINLLKRKHPVYSQKKNILILMHWWIN